MLQNKKLIKIFSVVISLSIATTFGLRFVWFVLRDYFYPPILLPDVSVAVWFLVFIVLNGFYYRFFGKQIIEHAESKAIDATNTYSSKLKKWMLYLYVISLISWSIVIFLFQIEYETFNFLDLVFGIWPFLIFAIIIYPIYIIEPIHNRIKRIFLWLFMLVFGAAFLWVAFRSLIWAFLGIEEYYIAISFFVYLSLALVNISLIVGMFKINPNKITISSLKHIFLNKYFYIKIVLHGIFILLTLSYIRETFLGYYYIYNIPIVGYVWEFTPRFLDPYIYDYAIIPSLYIVYLLINLFKKMRNNSNLSKNKDGKTN